MILKSNSENQIKFIRHGENKVIILDLSRFDDRQKKMIEIGLDWEVDVSVYANPEFDVYQMGSILHGLSSNVDATVYAKPEYDSNLMDIICICLESSWLIQQNSGLLNIS